MIKKNEVLHPLRTLSAIRETGELVCVRFSGHAIDRFRERVRPGIDERGAYLQIQGLASTAAVVADKPSWAARTKALLWLLVGDIAFPLVPLEADPAQLVATTCLTKSGPATGLRTSVAERSAER